MTDAEFLERMDLHLARGNEIAAESNALAATTHELTLTTHELTQTTHELMGDGKARMAEMKQLHNDTRQFMRDLMRRNEVFLAGLTRDMEARRAESVAGRQLLNDLHEESVAQRGAILALIDELREHGLGGRG